MHANSFKINRICT